MNPCNVAIIVILCSALYFLILTVWLYWKTKQIWNEAENILEAMKKDIEKS
jgi:hypothetical protein